MERKLLLTVSCITAISIGAAYIYAIRRKKRVYVTEKPQRKFKRVLADNSFAPFVHLQVPEEQGAEGGSHPYEGRIKHLLSQSSKPLKFSNADEPPSMEGPCLWIDKRSELVALSIKLSQLKVFAVDTEQHSLHSFLGFTALIQISTEKEDYLIDTIALHDDMGLMQSVFSDPAVCKVFHGADSDILWLQRDFHIYVVNLFDTAKACDVLGKPQRSLAYLLQTYCSVTSDKSFQRADWRVRPLPDAMVNYACGDVHYLLYIAECLSAELNGVLHGIASSQYASEDVGSQLFEEVVRRSNLMTLQLYEKEGSTSVETTALSLLSRYYNKEVGSDRNRYRRNANGDRFEELVRKLCRWRDSVARIEDESLRFVLSDQALILLARSRPSSAEKILDTISAADTSVAPNDDLFFGKRLASPSPIIYKYMKDIHSLFNEGLLDRSDSQGHEHRFRKNQVVQMSLKSKAMNNKHSEGPKKRHKESSRAQFVRKFSCKAPVYHNCRIYASDGRLLCYCDRKKLDWYLSRELAEVIEEDPPAIKLLFEPKGRPEDENNDFYIQSKQNICVGCGESSHYLRYRIIPSCYRMHFPEHLKSHRSHDIVLLCVDCHEIAHAAAEKHKRQVAAEFGIPLFAKKVVDAGSCDKETDDTEVLDIGEKGVSPLHLRTAAMALLRYGASMPKERREHLESVVRSYYKGREITQKDIEAAVLVGMGPREKRRLSKKGVALKNIDNDSMSMSGNNCSDNDQFWASETKLPLNLGKRLVESREDTTTEPKSFSHIVCESFCSDIVNKKDHDTVRCPKSLTEMDCSVSTNGTGDFDGSLNTSCKSMDQSSVNVESEKLSNVEEKIVDLSKRNDEVNAADESDSPKDHILEPLTSSSRSYSHAQKISLLGHGPHGKRVVEKLLNESGEDGIRKFCEQWRAVFVEAVKPCCLPVGWDVHHSGRREFGDYSVYNPSKRK